MILTYPNPLLREKVEGVSIIDEKFLNIANDLYNIMLIADGLGLSAIQAGILKNFFVINKNIHHHEIIINPQWKPKKNAKLFLATEGCLSFPNLFVKVRRYDKIKVTYQYKDGTYHNVFLNGLASHVFQHESDHLSGILMIDYLSLEEKRKIGVL